MTPDGRRRPSVDFGVFREIVGGLLIVASIVVILWLAYTESTRIGLGVTAVLAGGVGIALSRR